MKTVENRVCVTHFFTTEHALDLEGLVYFIKFKNEDTEHRGWLPTQQ